MQEKENDFSIEEKIGKEFAKARQKKSLSIRDIEQALKIRSMYIEHIEKGQFHNIVPEVYLSGFIKSYERFLGLEDDFWQQYTAEKEKRKKELGKKKLEDSAKEQEIPAEVSKGTRIQDAVPSNFLILLGVILLTGAIYVWYSYIKDRNIPKNEDGSLRAVVVDAPGKEGKKGESPVGKKASDRTSFVPSSQQLPAGGAGALPDAARVSQEIISLKKPYMKASEEAWVAFEDQDSKRILSRNMKENDTLVIPDKAAFIVIGNAGGANILMGDQVIKLGRRGEVRRHNIKKLFAQSSS